MEPKSNTLVKRESLAKQVKSAADWFFCIAALSLVNFVLSHSGSDSFFLAGLGVSLIIGGLAKEFGSFAYAVGIIMSLGASAFFCLFGAMARKGHSWAFIIGMILYALDGLLLLAFQEYFGAGFHLFALIFIFLGYRANRQLGQAPPEPPINLEKL